MLDEVAEITAGSDMPDIVRAMLCKSRALSHRGATDVTAKTEALALFREALTRNPQCRGEKRDCYACPRT